MNKDGMIERLETILKRSTYLQKMMELPGVIADFPKYKMFAKEHASLEKVAALYQEYKDVLANIEDAKILMNDADPEMAAMGKMEYEESIAKEEDYLQRLQIMLIPRDPNDDKNVIVEIRGAVGGDEGNIFAGDLFRMYINYAETQNWKIELLDSQESEMGGFSFVSFSVRGKEVYSKLKYESGAHRVQRVPKTEASGRIHTSTATVLIMPEAEEVDVVINPGDLRIDTYRSSGAGGQHINKTESAVRITHIPTGIVVTCQNERSQIRNKEKAMEVLKSKLYTLELEKQNEKIIGIKGEQLTNGWGSAKRSYVMCPYTLVKDSESGYETSNVDKILDGDIGEMLEKNIRR